MPPRLSISTHVIDGGAGGSRAGVQVTVVDRAGEEVGESITDDAGRIAELATGLEPGAYTVIWRTGGRVTTAVAVTFVLSEGRHYHLPLVASDALAVSYLGA